MPMSYDYYHVFYYVGKYRSFTRAAQKLLSSQPNVTRAMNNLEVQLNTKLFVRSSRGVELTEAGKKLYAHVELAFEQIALGEAELASVNALESGELTVAATEIALRKVLLPALKKYRALYPGVHIRIGNCSTPAALEALKTERADVAVATLPTDMLDTVNGIVLAEYRDILTAGAFYSGLCGEERSLRELTDYPWISLQRGTETFAFYDRFFLQHDLSFEPQLQPATMDQILPMVQSDLGLAFLPDFMAGPTIEAGDAFEIRLREPIPSRAVFLAHKSKKTLSRAASELVRILKKE